MLYVVRHGKTDYNKKELIMGRIDKPLNKEGLEEAYEVSKILSSIDIDLIISSPLIRAKQNGEYN